MLRVWPKDVVQGSVSRFETDKQAVWRRLQQRKRATAIRTAARGKADAATGRAWTCGEPTTADKLGRRGGGWSGGAGGIGYG